PAAIMDDERTARGRDTIAHDGDVGLRDAPFRPVVSDDIAGLVVLGKFGDGEARAVPREEAPHDFHAPMIDARIAAAETRGMDQFLKVNAECAIGADDDVRADAIEGLRV